MCRTIKHLVIRRVLAVSLVLGLFLTSVSAQEVAATSFEALKPGQVQSITSELGDWVFSGGVARIDPQHAASGTQCLHLTGGERTVAELTLSDQVKTDGALRFRAERWTVRGPFSFRVEKYSGDQWAEIYHGDRRIKVGRAFLSDVKIPLNDPSIEKLRFSVVSPAQTGILIDDVSIVPPKLQEIVAVDVQSLAVPVLLGAQHSPLAKLTVQTDGDLNPQRLASISMAFDERTELADLEAVELLFGGQVIARMETLSKGTAFELTPASDVGTLEEGGNEFTVACCLRKDANVDHQVQLHCDTVTLSGGRQYKLQHQSQPQRMGVSLRTGGDDGVHTYRIPGLATTNAGTLIAVYDIRHRSGGDLPGHIDVGMSRSTDGGRTWQPMQTIMDMGNDPKWHYDGIGDPAVLVDQTTGTIWVAATWSHGNRSWIGSQPGMEPHQTGQLMLVRSDDDGVTWSQPINITQQVKRPEWSFILQGPGKGITMQDGTIVFAAQYQDPPANRRLPHSTIIYSKDHGETWQVGSGAFDDTTEAQVVELQPGVLMLNCRYNRKSARVVMTSKDMGKTWQPHPTSERALIEPRACMASLIDVDAELGNDAGNWLLFSNPDSLSGRHHMTLKASPDQGNTWPKQHRLLLDEGRGGGYSCLSMIDEQTVGILYEGSQAHMTFQRVSLKDVLGDDHRQSRDAASRSDQPLDVFVVTGQSNSLGTVDPADYGQPLPEANSADAAVKFFWSNRSTRSGDATAALIGDSAGQWTTLQAQQGEGKNPVFWGPEIGFGRSLVAAGKRDVAIIKASRGGGGNSFWLKDAPDDHMYRHTLKTVTDAVRALPAGRRFRIRGIVYVQGESDNIGEAKQAGQRLEALLENLRRDLPYAEEAVLLVGGIAAGGARQDIVRGQQAAAAKHHPAIEYIGNRDLKSALYDGLHFNRAAKMEIGQRIAQAWLSRPEGKRSTLWLPKVFGSHMVLQANAPLPIWGKAAPGSQVTVQLDQDLQTVVANADGDWSVRMPQRSASTQAIELQVSTAAESISLRDILVGEVWVCAGQSNMEWRLNQSTNGRQELAALQEQDAQQIRLLDLTDGPRGVGSGYSAQQLGQLTPQHFVDGQWKVATAQTAQAFSAVGWYFGTHLQAELNVPVGLICPAAGGSPAEAWIPVEALEEDQTLKGLVAGNWLDSELLGEFCPLRGRQNLEAAIQAGESIPTDLIGPNHPFKPGFLWSATMEPMIPFAIAGVIWYQGESNAETRPRVAQHGQLFPLLIRQWRQKWGQGDFPFLLVQLPSMNRPYWPEFRESQRVAQQQLPNVGMAVTIDTGHPTNVHPPEKKIVGQRLARWALGTTYQSPKHSVYSGPLPVAAVRQDALVRVSFHHAGQGLKSSDGQSLRYFEVAGADGQYHPAVAKLGRSGSVVELSSAAVESPSAVRYAWVPFAKPVPNLVNSQSLPATPFELTVK